MIGPALQIPKAARFDTVIAVSGQPQFLQSSLKVLPSLLHLLFACTFSGVGIHAQQDHAVGRIQTLLLAAFLCGF